MKDIERIKICPKCSSSYFRPSAISREDNTTRICPKCGTREALKAMKLEDDEIEEIIKIIEKYN